MKKIYLLLITGLLFSGLASAQVTGVKNIPADYATLAAAIADLNTVGVGAGGATINVPTGYTETAPSGGFVLGSATLNASLSASNPLTITKSGLGVNPLLTAPVGTSTTVDAIFIIQGADYTTINGLDLQESSGNTSAVQAMERGFFIVNLNGTAPFDGCQNDVIQNCTITLNRTLLTPCVGIYFNHSTAAGTALTITTTGDAHSNNKVYGNKITNCIRGIYMIGFAAASPYTLYDQGNDIGGTSAATGNTITNFGTTYATVAGIIAQYQNALNVSYNTVNNLADGGAVTNGVMYGIDVYGLNSTFTVNNNNVTVSETPTATTYYIYAIACDGGTTFTANNNIVSSTLVSGSANASIQNAALINSATNFNASGNTLSVTHGNNGPPVSVFNSGTGSINVSNNTHNFSNTSATTQAYLGVYSSTALSGSLTVQNNTFNASSSATASGNYYGVYSGALISGTETISDNKFASISYNTTANMILLYASNNTNNKIISNNSVTGSVAKNSAGNAFYGYYNVGVPTGGTATISGNNFSNITLTGATGFFGINHAITGTSQTVNAYNNVVASSTLGSSSSAGIFFSGGAAGSLYNNRVNSLSGTGGTLNGISLNLGLANSVYKNKVYDLQENNATGIVNGILIAGGTNASTNTVYNNLIGDLRAPITSSTSDAVRGISITSASTTSNINLYYNSIYLNATSTGTNFNTSGIFHTFNTTAATASLTLRNNIIVNNSTPNGSGFTSAFRRSANTNLNNFNTASNNNIFYAGIPGASRLIYYDGTTTYPVFGPAATAGTYQNLVATRDANSFTENPPFLSTTGSSANFLHMNPALPTAAESGAVNISPITTDYDGDIRAGNLGYPGTGTAPDIGADEFDLTIDVTAPDITYTPITNSCSTGDRTLSAVITDATGVPTSGTLVPRVYYKKGLLGTWYSQPGTLSSGSATNGTWGFTIVASDMGGLTGGDVVYYYVIAQDVATIPNIGSNAAGAVATDVNTVAVPPLLPNSFSVTLTLSGNYNVGSAGAFPTLTAAVAAYNAGCLGGPVSFTLTDATYPSETFPITINANANSSSTNTLTIKPASSATISGSNANAIIKLNGADYIIIDGSNSGGTDKSLTISNTNASTTSGIIWLSAPSAANPVTNNVIKNCNISGTAANGTAAGIASSGASIFSLSLATNVNNTLQNNNISLVQEGVLIYGPSAAGADNNWLITQNNITNVGFNALYLNNMQNYTVSNNTISNVVLAGTPYLAAIEIELSHLNGSFIKNTISNIRNSATGGTYGAMGIYLGSSSTTSNVTVSNNFIYDISANGNASLVGNSHGIYAASGGGYKIYYNTVVLSLNQLTTTGTCAAMTINGVTTAASMDIRNNIFANLQTTGAAAATRYAIYSANANTIFSNIDYNDYYTTGTNLGFLASNRVAIGNIQAGFGGNLNSLNALPTFVSSSNYHLATDANCALDGAGNNNGILLTDDIDAANVRSITTPFTTDIGADEFTGNFLLTITNPPAACSVDITAASVVAGSTVPTTIVYYQTDGVTVMTPAAAAAITVSGTYFIKYIKGTCTSTQPVFVTVAANPAANAQLATAATNGLDLLKICDDASGWTYYADPSDATKYLFAINWNPSGLGGNTAAQAAATTRIQVDGADATVQNSGIPEGTWTMKRYWNVDLHGTTLGNPVNVRFFYSAAEKAATDAAAATFQGSFGGSIEPPTWFKTKTTTFVGDAAHMNADGVYDAIGLVDVNAGPASTFNGVLYAEFQGITSFSGGTYATGVGPNTPLPVTFNYLRGVKQSGNHLLSWKVTCNSTPKVTLVLERSADSRNFNDVYSISADAARCQQEFTHTDANPLNGINYYRLRIIDADGKITYSNIISLINAVKGFEVMNIAPNPVTSGSFKLNVTSAVNSKMDVVITDMQGRVINKQTVSLIAGYNSLDMNVGNLASGTYNIYGTTAQDKSKVIRFVKQ